MKNVCPNCGAEFDFDTAGMSCRGWKNGGPCNYEWAPHRTEAQAPTEAQARKSRPVCTGVLDYFPDALQAVAEVSRVGNAQHNPGQPLHWDRSKSTDQADCLARHLIDRGKLDTDGTRHSAKVAWRALALLQLEIEADRAKGAK
jgi:Domain of unknown function (DUF5664)